MTDSSLGLLVVFVYVAAVILSLPAAAAVLLLSKRFGVRRATDLVGLAGAAVVAVAALSVGVLAEPLLGVTLAGIGIVALALLWALPVLVGAFVVHRLAGSGDEAALGYAVAGLPPALLGSAIWSVVPSGLTRYDLTPPTGFPLGVAMGVFLVVVLVGPGLVGTGLYRVAGRVRQPEGEFE